MRPESKEIYNTQVMLMSLGIAFSIFGTVLPAANFGRASAQIGKLQGIVRGKMGKAPDAPLPPDPNVRTSPGGTTVHGAGDGDRSASGVSQQEQQLLDEMAITQADIPIEVVPKLPGTVRFPGEKGAPNEAMVPLPEGEKGDDADLNLNPESDKNDRGLLLGLIPGFAITGTNSLWTKLSPTSTDIVAETANWDAFIGNISALLLQSVVDYNDHILNDPAGADLLFVTLMGGTTMANWTDGGESFPSLRISRSSANSGNHFSK